MIDYHHWEEEYVLSHDWDWIRDRFNKMIRSASYQKIWELNKISLSRQPQTESDASSLSDSFREIFSKLEDNIRISEGRKSKAELYDGEMQMVG